MIKLLRFIFQQVEVLFRASFVLFCELTNLEVLAGLCFSLVGLSRLMIFLFYFSFPAFSHLTFGSWHTKMPREEGPGRDSSGSCSASPTLGVPPDKRRSGRTGPCCARPQVTAEGGAGARAAAPLRALPGEGAGAANTAPKTPLRPQPPL